MRSTLKLAIGTTVLAAAVTAAGFAEPAPQGESAADVDSRWAKSEGVMVRTSGGQTPEWTNRRYDPTDLWAYRPVQEAAVPDLPVSAVAGNPIDAFVQKRLSEQQLQAAPPAERLTLLRRVTIGLTGLPPTPAEVEAFLSDNAPDAYARLVDRLLASPHYGEQTARMWLDVVRYADTSGFSNDYERPNAWRYRDYVIRSFNSDKPYDRFVVEQLAGDELDPEDPEMLIAVGFLRMGPWEHTGMSVAAVTRQQFLDDVTNAVGVTFLAQGLRCCRCHDHKFDPLPTRDYYRMQAVFAPVQFADRPVPYLPVENTTSFARTKPRIERLHRDAKELIASLRQKHRRAVAEFLQERGVQELSDLPESERPKRHYGLTPLDMSLEKIYRKRIAYYERELKRYRPLAFSLYSGPPNNYTSTRPVQMMPPPEKRKGSVEAVHILPGGSLETPGEAVSSGVLSAVSFTDTADALIRADDDQPGLIPQSAHGRRLALARWITHPDHPLTARVIVNRLWQHHFGAGLVATPNNFGKMGGRPSHPKLLDWLARWFMDRGWSIKRLNRLIVTSAAYRQSGQGHDMARAGRIDPDNRLLSYFPPRRLTAEEIRDAMLAVTGELNAEMGGPGVYPEINREVALQPRHIMGSVAPAYQPSPLPRDRNRRTIYAFRFRTLADPMLEVFDRPGTDKSCERREETTVAPQAFALFNGRFVHDRALALAARVRRETDGDPAAVERAFRLIHGRAPEDEERSWCLHHVRRMTGHHRRTKPAARTLPRTVNRKMVEELTGRDFEWTETLDQMEHYQPDLRPGDVDAETRGLAELCLVLLNSNEFLYVR